MGLILICIWILVLLEKADFADGGYDSAVTVRVRSSEQLGKSFVNTLLILTGKGFSLKLKVKVYATCVRSCLMHGSETCL